MNFKGKSQCTVNVDDYDYSDDDSDAYMLTNGIQSRTSNKPVKSNSRKSDREMVVPNVTPFKGRPNAEDEKTEFQRFFSIFKQFNRK